MSTKEGLKIAYRPIDPEQCKYVLEGIAEGLVLGNVAEMDSGHPAFSDLVAEGVTYEEPQKDCANDQEVGLLSQVLEKGRATCLEAAAIAAAAERRAGNAATVEIEFERDSYGKPIPWSYHAYTRVNGELYDPSAALSRVAVGGACCSSCAHGGPCESGCPDHDHSLEVGGACCSSCAHGGPCESECGAQVGRSDDRDFQRVHTSPPAHTHLLAIKGYA